MSFIYAYDELPVDLSTNGYTLTDWEDLPEINRILNNDFTFYGNYSINGQNVNYLKEGNFVRAQDENGKNQYFEIYKVVKNLNSFSISARAIGYMLSRNFIENAFVSSGNGTTIMNKLKASLAFEQPFSFSSTVSTVHQFTVKQTNPIDAMIGSNNGNENLASVTDGELDMDNYNIKLLSRIGEDNGYRVDLGVNLESIEEEVDNNYYNSLYLIGGVPEGDYDENKEPITYKYLETTGVTDKNRRIGKYENSECLTVEDLKKWGQTKFDNDRVHEPSVTHSVSMVNLEHTLEYKDVYDTIASLHFGDTCHVKVAKLGIEVSERMVEYTWYPTLGKYKEVILGNDITFYTNNVATETAKLKQKVEKRTEVLVEAVRNASSWITGTKGGYVRFRPEKAPSEILIMDTDDVRTAKKVWRWNLGGLGYSNNGVDGPFELAMTRDGAIVADFITVGILRAITIIGVEIFGSTFETMNADFLKMRIKDGSIHYFKSDKDGEDIGDRLGYISMLNPDRPAIHIQNDIEGKDSKMWLDEENIVLQHSDLIQLRANTVKASGRLDVKELYVNGVKIDKNGGGSGGGNPGGNWNGQYPPEVTTQAEKFAWQAWVTLLSLGYSKAAAAGILGNIQGEAGPGMNPDTDQVGGPAYGAIQFDGSSYPLIGEPTWNGREYFQRLHNASGVGGDYRDMTVQMKVVNWTMTNGQWIGKVDPTSVSGFKAIASPERAAYAFENNFERPAWAHPEREGYARNWYNKFNSLDIPEESNGWALPIARPITVTSEFGWRTSPIDGSQELHNGIDLVNNDSATPILAAESGIVRIAGSYPAWYGNYVVIEHANGIFTGYAHQSSLNVSVGQQVMKGQRIGTIGTTGPSTGIHLHFQFFRNGPWPPQDDFINPRTMMNFS